MEQEDSKYKCCQVKNMCGKTLAQSVVFIGVYTLVVSLSSVILALISLYLTTCSERPISEDPENAVNLIIALVAAALSTYQFIISLLVLWQASQSKPRVYLLCLWYVSHLSILTVYSMMFIARAAVCFAVRDYFPAVVTVVVASGYIGIFLYFIIVMNSYIRSVDEVRYF